MPRASLPMAAVLLLAALHMLVFDRGLGGDGWASFAALESLVDDGDLHLENNLRGVDNGIVPTPSGHRVMQYPPGILLLDLPPFLAGRAADAVLPGGLLAGGVDLPPVGRVPRKVFLEAAAIVLARNAATLLGLVFLAGALRRLGWGGGTVAAAVALTFFGGPLLFYSLVGMTHAPTFALASLLLLLLVKQREEGSIRLALAAGAVLGLATLVRYGAVGLLPAALLGALRGPTPLLASPHPHPRPRPGGRDPVGGLVDFFGSRSTAPPITSLPPGREGGRGWGEDRRGVGPGGTRRFFAFVAGFAAPLLLLPLYWHAGSGSWGPPGYGGVWHFTLATPWNVLLSLRHGLFLFHPALLLAALGLAWAAASELARRAPGMGTVALLAFLGIAVLHGGWSEWANPGGYGQRFLIDALPFLGLGFARILAARPRWAWRGGLVLATVFGYILFFTAVAGLVPPPPPYPWPQRLSDYRPLLVHPSGPAELWAGMRRASLTLRAAGSHRLSQ